MVMMSTDLRVTVIELAAIALLSEAKAAGLNLQEVAESAKKGISGDASYAKGSKNEAKSIAINAIDYLIQSVKP